MNTLLALFVISFSMLSHSASLPTKCATGEANQIRLLNQKNPHIQAVLTCNDIEMTGENSQHYHISPSGYFEIGYDSEGMHAVDLADGNSNGIPDYVDSVAYYFDFAYELEVNQLGYKDPLYFKKPNQTLRYRIYIKEYGPCGYYGLTNADDVIETEGNVTRFSSSIFVDNNFSELDSVRIEGEDIRPSYKETGISALKITAVHEFHHAIQFVYNGNSNNNTMPEMTSTFMEWRAFPETRDYFQWVQHLLQNPMLRSFTDVKFKSGAENGYMYSIFAQYIYERFGDGLLLETWKSAGNGSEPTKALDAALLENGSSLADAFCGFTEWIYHTGQRAKPGEFFIQAGELPELMWDAEMLFAAPYVNYSAEMPPFTFTPIRVFFAPDDTGLSSDTLDVIISNTDTASAFDPGNPNGTWSMMNFLATNAFQENYTKAGDLDYYFSVADEHGIFCEYFNTFGGSPSDALGYCYPNPLNIRSASTLTVQVPPSARLFDKVTVQILTSGFLPAYTGEHQVTADTDKRFIQMTAPADLPDGVYVVRAQYNDEVRLSKLAVIRK